MLHGVCPFCMDRIQVLESARCPLWKGGVQWCRHVVHVHVWRRLAQMRGQPRSGRQAGGAFTVHTPRGLLRASPFRGDGSATQMARQVVLHRKVVLHRNGSTFRTTQMVRQTPHRTHGCSTAAFTVAAVQPCGAGKAGLRRTRPESGAATRRRRSARHLLPPLTLPRRSL